MKAGNAVYEKPTDLPEIVPVFPLAGALLLPGCRLPLNIFEPRYRAMIDHVLAGSRLIGMVQPRFARDEHEALRRGSESPLCEIGCVGRLVSFTETGDGRYIASLEGVCRFHRGEELRAGTAFRQCRVAPFVGDLGRDDTADDVDRASLLKTLQAYLDANNLEMDWESVERAKNDMLVNTLSMMAPYGPAEKQALLEAPNLKVRAETLVAITEMVLARESGEGGVALQ